MKIFSDLESISSLIPGSAVALGTFDGVHIGHQKIITKAVDWAKQTGAPSIVFTFSNHPLSIIAPERCPPQIIDPKNKAFLISQLGTNILVSIPFTPYFSQLSPDQFISIFSLYFKPGFVVVGPNYSFGYRGAGTPEMLKAAGQISGFEVYIHEAVYIDSILVSSTTIRKLIAEGNVCKAASLLGRPYHITGKVVEGDHRGRILGFPTANLEIPRGLIAVGDGVYAVTVFIEGARYNGIANVGNNPTFVGKSRRIEVHIFEFCGDIYGQILCIEFVNRLRGEMTFKNSEQLIQQIHIDREKAKEYFKN